MKSIAVVSVGRSDYGIYRPLIKRIQADPELNLSLIVSSAHFDMRFGETYREIERDGIAISRRVECETGTTTDTPKDIGTVMGKALAGFAEAYSEIRPDWIVVLGDRYEMHAAAAAAVPFLIPLAHIGGGAVGRGAIDDSFRHSISKMSHIHFTEIQQNADCLCRLGEAPWRIHITGALGLDNISEITLFDLETLNERFGLSLKERPILATFHPVTRELGQAKSQFMELLAALRSLRTSVLFTYPNADSEGRVIIDLIKRAVETDPLRFFAVPHLGTEGYYSAMSLAKCMIGNSSSGIIEAASFGLPVVNVGNRQQDRFAPANVIHCQCNRENITAALNTALDKQFALAASIINNPYGNGNSGEKITSALKTIEINDKLIRKEAP